MSINLKQFGLIAISSLLLVMFGLFGVAEISESGAERVEKHTVDASTKVFESVVPLLKLSSNIRFSAVQIQQLIKSNFINHGSLQSNGGLVEVKAYASKFKKDTEQAIRLAQSENLNEIVVTLKDLQNAFPTFLAAGHEMDGAYVSGDQADAREIMAKFDASAEQLLNAMEDNEALLNAMLKDIKGSFIASIEGAKKQRVVSKTLIISMLLFALVVITIFGIKGKKIISDVTSLSETMDIVKKGRITRRILNIKRTDEIGIMQHAFNDLMDLTEFFVRDAGACMKAFSSGVFERKILPDGLTGRFREVAQEINNGIEAMGHKNGEFAAAGSSFETGVKGNFDTIRESMASLQQSSETLLGLADDSNREAEVVVEATSTSVNGVQAVATATEELSASIQEIGRQVSNSAELVSESAAEAQNAAGQIKELSEASVKIGDVVEIITGIAEQTNLLALNATIESARAGEAGKGFAVVAQEVKALAAQTGSATDEVRAQVETIQSQTSNAVQVIEAVSNRMAQVNEAVTAIAAAVEEQGAATNEISSSIDTVSTETTRMSDAVELLQAAIVKTRSSATEMNSSTNVVNDVSGTVATDIDRFMDTMKAATG
jgi:methyl-accepting chemotaxis protein